MLSDLVESVSDAIRNDSGLHGGGQAINCSPPEVTVWDVREITSDTAVEITCHYAELTFNVEEEMIIAYV